MRVLCIYRVQQTLSTRSQKQRKKWKNPVHSRCRLVGIVLEKRYSLFFILSFNFNSTYVFFVHSKQSRTKSFKQKRKNILCIFISSLDLFAMQTHTKFSALLSCTKTCAPQRVYEYVCTRERFIKFSKCIKMLALNHSICLSK